jgi:ribose transport system permease protein
MPDNLKPTQTESMAVIETLSGDQALSPRRRSAVTAVVDLGIVFAFVALVAIGVAVVPGFASSGNVRAILFDSAFLGIVAIGMTFVTVSGNFLDLSVVAQVGTAAVVVIVVGQYGLWLGILAAIASTLPFAAANALGVGVMRANGVVVTLAVQTSGLGILLYLTGGAQYNMTSTWLNGFATSFIGPLPWVFVIMLLIGVSAEFVLQRTNLGLSIRSLGSQREASRAAGVGVYRTVFGTYALVAVACAIAGILLAGFNNNALPSIGTGFDFNALAAVIIGGTSLFGGRGSVMRTVVGVLFVATLLNMSILIGLPFEWQQFVKGLIIVVAVASDALLRKRGAR